MSKRPKIFEDELRAKRVYTKIEKASNLPKNYNKKTNQGFKKPMMKNTPRGKEVVIKITGNSKNFQHWKAHLDYVTRKGELEIVADKDTKYQGLEDNKAFSKFFNNSGSAIPNDYENLKEKREVLNFVFSMKNHETTPKDKLIEAVLKTMKEKYPNNATYAVFHGDTDNPHIHCDLKIAGEDGKRIDVRKNDLLDMRVKFAKNLNDLGIEATATRKYSGKSKDRTKEEIKEHKEKLYNNHFEVVEFGEAKYQFDDRNSSSYFVKYKTSKDEITTIWGKELEKVIKENDIAPGEFVKFRKVDKAPVETVIRKKSKNGKREVFIKNGFKDVWDCSILGRAEKDLKVNPNMKNLKTTFTQDIKDISEQEKKTAEFLKAKKEKEAKQGLNLSSQNKSNKFANLKKKEDLER